ncbi:IclR family transcriptional regulator [Halobellus clavatus]|jgi:DNA-binding IclR family transcriptional regulator|uniref:Transcriptional regulator, IclR family n=1 Tax=Halobellus clavatus TaxID=660517 RepID=A0A1H3JK15_9EURY|nr:IclR family transcriptional regulator [Halobellus clavatus]SDY40272.1 transcriptional regulator, IclR family [Halobellus clavatus]
MTDQSGESSTGDSAKHVDATRKSLDILRYLKENGPASLSAVASDLDRAKSTVYRHLNTLEEAGYIAEYNGGYRIGQLYLDYGIQAQRSHPLYYAAKPKVDALADQVGEKVWCVVEENGFAVYIYLKSGDELYRSFTRVGFRGYLHAFSAGKAILAQMAPERVESIITSRGLPAYTEQTITAEDALYEELEEIRERGFAVHLEEAVSGGNAVSVPIQLDDGSPIGSICIAGPAHRLDEETLVDDYSDRLLGVKNEIELSLKYESAPVEDRTERPHNLERKN